MYRELQVGSRVRQSLGYFTHHVRWCDQVELMGADVGTIIKRTDVERDNYSSFVSATVRWDDGRITEETDLVDVTPMVFVNVYLHDRAYGGSEEGGWWYDTYDPEPEKCVQYASEAEAEQMKEKLQLWCDEENSQRRSDVSSVLSEGRYVVRIEAFPAAPYPEYAPYYC